jgi:hypothetical protein
VAAVNNVAVSTIRLTDHFTVTLRLARPASRNTEYRHQLQPRARRSTRAAHWHVFGFSFMPSVSLMEVDAVLVLRTYLQQGSSSGICIKA